MAADHAERAVQWSQQVVDASRRLRSDLAAMGSPRFFVVRGKVDGVGVRASWFRGSLTASDSLLDRGELLVKLGEHFVDNASGLTVEADLGTPLAAMLTLVRACDQVVSVRFGPYDPRASRHHGRGGQP